MNTAASLTLHSDVTGSSFVWTYLWYVDAPTWLWVQHIAALVVMAMLVLGLFSRVTAVLTWFITVSYCHRLEGSLFGLDQVNAMVAIYLMVRACGDALFALTVGYSSGDTKENCPRSHAERFRPTSPFAYFKSIGA